MPSRGSPTVTAWHDRLVATCSAPARYLYLQAAEEPQTRDGSVDRASARVLRGRGAPLKDYSLPRSIQIRELPATRRENVKCRHLSTNIHRDMWYIDEYQSQ